MSELIPLNPNETLTMSSREIADLVESEHKNVKRSIERLIDKGVIEHSPMEKVKNHLGQTVSEYHLAKRDTYIVVAQLSPQFTARLVDRWQELESQATVPKPSLEMHPALLHLIENQNKLVDRLLSDTESRVKSAQAPEWGSAEPNLTTPFMSTRDEEQYIKKAIHRVLDQYRPQAFQFRQLMKHLGPEVDSSRFLALRNAYKYFRPRYSLWQDGRKAVVAGAYTRIWVRPEHVYTSRDAMRTFVAQAFKDKTQRFLSPTDIANLTVFKSARTVNLELIHRGLQVKVLGAQGRTEYRPTEAGNATGAVVVNTGKFRQDGSAISNLRWKPEIVTLLNKGIAA